MTTPSKAEQKRPRAIYSGGVIYAREKIYIASEADAIFESLETELAVTRRALEMIVEESKFNTWETGDHPWDVDGWIIEARKERGQ